MVGDACYVIRRNFWMEYVVDDGGFLAYNLGNSIHI